VTTDYDPMLEREGVRWTDAQQRAGFYLALRVWLLLALGLAVCAVLS